MSYTICTHCSAKINAPQHAEGKSAKCPKCSERFTITILSDTVSEVPPSLPPVSESDTDKLDTSKWESIDVGATSASKVMGVLNKIRDETEEDVASGANSLPEPQALRLRKYPVLETLGSLAAAIGFVIGLGGIAIGFLRISNDDLWIGIPVIGISVLVAIVPILFSEVIHLFVNIANNIELIAKRVNQAD